MICVLLSLSSVDQGTNVYVLLSINWPKFGCLKLFVHLVNVVMLPHSVTPFLKLLLDVCGLGEGVGGGEGREGGVLKDKVYLH